MSALDDEFQCVEKCMNGVDALKKANLLLSLYPSFSHTNANLFYAAVKSVRVMARKADILLGGGGKTLETYYQNKFESSLQQELQTFKVHLTQKSMFN